MTNLYYACNLTIDFEAFDLDFVLNYIEQKHFELRILPRNDDGINFIPFALKIYSQRDMRDFIVNVGRYVADSECYPISEDIFETGNLIDIRQENRQHIHLTYDSLRRAIEDSNKFFRYVYYPSKPVIIYRADWKLNIEGLQSSFIENMFNIESKNKNVRVAESDLEDNLMMYFFVAIPKDDDFNKILSEFPDEAKSLKWEQINLQQVPSRLYGNPLNMDGNIYSIWRESLLNALLNI